MASQALGERRCKSKPYPTALLASRAAGAFDAYSSKRLELREALLARQMEKDYAERYQQAEAALHQQMHQKERLVAAARKHIVEKILTLACPKCGLAFFDFDGCYALTCNGCRWSYWI